MLQRSEVRPQHAPRASNWHLLVLHHITTTQVLSLSAEPRLDLGWHHAVLLYLHTGSQQEETNLCLYEAKTIFVVAI